MKDTKFYFRVQNQRPIFGPYDIPDFWKLVSEGRLHESVELSTTEVGPWISFRDFLFQGDFNSWFYLPKIEANSVGPVNKEYLKYLLMMGSISLSTPISNSANGPWKLIKESDCGAEFEVHFAKYPSRIQSQETPLDFKIKPTSSLHISQSTSDPHSTLNQTLSESIASQSPGNPSNPFPGRTIEPPKFTAPNSQENTPNTSGNQAIRTSNGSTLIITTGAVLIIFSVWGSMAGAGSPFSLLAFGLTLLLNPILWLAIWLIYFGQRKVHCPYCHTNQIHFLRNSRHTCQKCGMQFNIPA
jgi:hypothetical protein